MDCYTVVAGPGVYSENFAAHSIQRGTFHRVYTAVHPEDAILRHIQSQTSRVHKVRVNYGPSVVAKEIADFNAWPDAPVGEEQVSGNVQVSKNQTVKCKM